MTENADIIVNFADEIITLDNGYELETSYEDGDIIYTVYTGTAIEYIVRGHRGLSFADEDRAAFIADAIAIGIPEDEAKALDKLACNIYDYRNDLI